VPLARRSWTQRTVGSQPSVQTLRDARGSLEPAVVLFTTSVCAVGLMTFLSIDAPSSDAAAVALLGFGLAATVTRWRAGVSVDRWGLAGLLAVSALAVSVGMTVVAISLLLDGTAFGITSTIGCLLAGLGYGGVQTLSLMAALRRVADSAVAGASAVWNIAFDSGIGVGALMIGLTAGAIGMSWTFVLIAVLLALVSPVSRIAGRPPTG
jgi:predicted MFS family arabinose efflux permease